jgi:hypothetical protein
MEMSIVVNGRDGNPFDQNSMDGLQGRYINAFYKLAMSGSAAAGGDTLDFTNGGVNSAVPPLVRGIASMDVQQLAASSSTFLGGGGYFCAIGTPGVPGASGVTLLTAWKLLGFSNGGSAQSGAYSGFTPGSPVTDTVILNVIWFR